MSNYGLGCGEADVHAIHHLRYAEVGQGVVLCAGLQPPAEITYDFASSVIGVTFDSAEGGRSQRVCLYEGDQHSGMTLPSGNVPRYVAGARAAYELSMRGTLAASTMDRLLKEQ